MNVIFIFAHPDDAEIYSGGLMVKLHEQKENFRVCCVANKQKDENLNQIRKHELCKSMQLINIVPDFMNIEDGEFVWSAREMNRIAQYINIHNPDMIVTHNKYDYHYDHRHVSEVVHNIASYQYPVLMADTLCGNMHEPAYFCNITKYMKKKLDMLMCHESQLKLCDYINIVKVLNAYRALQYTGMASGFFEGYSCNFNYHLKEFETRIQKILGDNIS